MRTRPSGRFTALMLGLALVSACTGEGGSSSGAADASVEPSTYAAMSPTELVTAIAEAPGIAQALAATQVALSRGGIDLTDTSKVYLAAVEPRSGIGVTPSQSVGIAYQARDRKDVGVMTLDDLAGTLSSGGFLQGEGSPGDQLRSFLKGWVIDAQASPDDPASFTPLFLAAMARLQEPPVDLAKGNYSPGELHLGLLDVQLFGAAMYREALALGMTLEPPAIAVSSVTDTPDVATTNVTLASSDNVAPITLVTAEAGPCTAAKEWMNELVPGLGAGESWKATIKELSGMGQEAGMEMLFHTLKLTITGPGQNAIPASPAQLAKAFGSAMAAIKALMKIATLVDFYSRTSVEVSAQPAGPIHKPVSPDTQEIVYTATAGVSDEDWEASQSGLFGPGGISPELYRADQVLRDCAAALDFEPPPDIEDLAGDVKNWSVEWDVKIEPSDLAKWSLSKNTFDSPSQRQVKLQMSPNGRQGTSKFVVDVNPEDTALHSSNAPTESGFVTASASVDAGRIPELDVLYNAVVGGATSNPVEVASGALDVTLGGIKVVFQPRAWASVDVTYHTGGDFLVEGSVPAGGGATIKYKGLKCGGPGGTWKIDWWWVGLPPGGWARGSTIVNIDPTTLKGRWHIERGRGGTTGFSAPLNGSGTATFLPDIPALEVVGETVGQFEMTQGSFCGK